MFALALLGIFASTSASSAGDPLAPSPFEVVEFQKDFGVSAHQAEHVLRVQAAGIEADVVGKIEDRMKGRYAGIWFDNASGEYVVPILPNISSEVIASEFVDAGLSKGEFRTSRAQSSWSELEAARRDLDRHLASTFVPTQIQTSLDPRSNEVLIEHTAGLAVADRDWLRRVASTATVQVEVRESRVKRFSGRLEACTTAFCDRPLRGGVKIYRESSAEEDACTAGFPVVGNATGNRYLLTAGHCVELYSGAPVVMNWESRDSALTPHRIGTVEQWQYPGGDWAKINANNTYWDGSPWASEIVAWGGSEHYPITGTATSVPGYYACLSGIMTGTTCGYIGKVNVSCTFGEASKVDGLAELVGALSKHGNSGGPIFTGNKALGTLTGTCAGSQARLFTDINRSMEALGVHLPPPPPPAVETGAATAVKEFQADVGGSVNPNGSATTYHFEYGPSPSLGYTAPIPDGNAGSSSSPVAVGTTLSRLDPGTTYHYRLVATNASGTSYGQSKSFHTPGWRFMSGISSGSGVSSWEATASMALPSMASGDFTGDSKADVVAIEFDGNSAYRYRLGTSHGSGIAGWSTVISGMSAPTRLAVGDFTGDGKADIVAVESAGGGKYRYMLGTSNGSGVSSWTLLPGLGEMSYPHKMSLGDFTGDGKADIVSVESTGNGKYRYMLGTSNGSGVSNWGQLPALGEMDYAEFMDLADFTGDGKSDIVSVESEGANQYRFMVGTSNGSVVSDWDKVMDQMSGPYFFNVAQFNADGKADIVSVESEGNGKYRYMLGLSSGNGISSWSKVLSEMSLARGSDLADVTGDGKADVVSLETESTGSYSYRLGTSSGTGVSSWDLLVSWMRQPNRVDLADFNADGKADILSVESEGNGQYRYVIGTSNSSGTSNWLTVLSKMSSPAATALADFTGDGKADVIGLESEGNGKYRYKVGVSTGTGISAWNTVLSGLSLPTRSGVGDFTGDGKADILAVEPESIGKYRYMFGLGNGAGISSWSQVLSGMSYPHKMAVGDLSGDGRADIVVVEGQGNGKYRYMFSKGATGGLSGWSQIMAEMSYAEFMDLGDFTGDGKADVASVENEGGGKFRFMLGTSNGAGIASWNKVMDQMSGPYFFHLGDLNGDSRADIVSLEAM